LKKKEEGNRERETDWVERETTETEKHKKKRNIGWEIERDRRGEERKRTEGINQRGRKRRLVSLHRGEEAPLLSLGLTVIATAAPSRTATVTVSSAIRDHRLR
jgi:hypothetical protein